MAQILRVLEAFSVLSDPDGHVYTPGELVAADHPHVKGREDKFETVEAHVKGRGGNRDVEAATAAPGEKRTRTAPKRRGAPRKAAKAAPKPTPKLSSEKV